MKPMISVIIPVLNREKEIEECIHSVVCQSYENWELLIIDNGSSDTTVELCRKLAAQEPRIRLLDAPRGVSRARNAGIEAAQGQYLFFLDSDDVIHPSLLETLLVSMERHNAGMAGTARVNIHQSQWADFAKKSRTHKGIGKTRFLTNAEALQAIFRYTTPLNIIGGVMVLRSLVDQTRFRQDLHIGEDFFFMYENLIKGPDILFVEPIWYFARLHESNLSWDYSFEGFRSRFERRKLVWLSEEALGRSDNAKIQMQDALNVYLRCLKQQAGVNPETDRMRKVMKQNHRVLFSGLTLRQKLVYLLTVNFPGVYLKFFCKS